VNERNVTYCLGNSGSREKEINQVIANDREKSNEIEDFLLLVLENETFSLQIEDLIKE
jgi:hypothetical protein